MEASINKIRIKRAGGVYLRCDSSSEEDQKNTVNSTNSKRTNKDVMVGSDVTY